MKRNRRTALRAVCGLIFAFVFAQVTIGAAADDDYFRQQVAPIFEQRCVSCHSGAKPKGGLSLTNAKSALAGGENGAAIVPGAPIESMLLDYISGNKPAMPKSGPPLKADEVAIVRHWIESGAAWPAAMTLSDKKPLDLNWWSLLPLKKTPVPPADSHWVRNADRQFPLGEDA